VQVRRTIRENWHFRRNGSPARAQATELDDNRSDAKSIATAVAQSCRTLRVKMVETSALKNTPAGRQLVDRLVSEDINRATLFVLQERAKQK
jgi:hypothetical protein